MANADAVDDAAAGQMGYWANYYDDETTQDLTLCTEKQRHYDDEE